MDRSPGTLLEKMFTILRYTHSHRSEWDQFVEKSRNGTFLFKRDYMEYHSDRYHDHSLMVYSGERLVALLPACEQGGVYSTHAGLTYGGFVIDSWMGGAAMVALFAEWVDYLRAARFDKIVYKCVPSIYHRQPAQEEEYALFRSGFVLFRRDLSTVIRLDDRDPFTTLRRRKIKQAERQGVVVERSSEWKRIWPVFEENLRLKYNTRPVHTSEEMERLHRSFPESIELWVARQADEWLGGVVLYLTAECTHVQYSLASERGKEMGVMDALYDQAIRACATSYFDFGISTEEQGRFLNENLLFMKEGFGGRSVVYDQYELIVK